MNSFENLTIKQRSEVKENLLKQIKAIEKLEESDKSTSSSIFKISLFSKEETPKTEKVEKPKVEKVKVEKVKSEKVKSEKVKSEKVKVDKVKVEKVEKPKVEKVVKVKITKSESSDDDKKPRAIKATIPSMKEVLDYHHVNYASNAKKEDLAKLLRENNLVREAEKKELFKQEDK